ncbi:subtilase family protein [Actinidia rufa]|uniref:Subtilase family protein n=1 Tax=Actinidia rufa TaxID=165716 RepID=A0A7J0F6Y1_9ERIC|nr:subtilase family protein [Actinidia rufa]
MMSPSDSHHEILSDILGRPHVVNGIRSKGQSGVGLLSDSWTLEYGLNLKALEMWACERFRLVGKGMPGRRRIQYFMFLFVAKDLKIACSLKKDFCSSLVNPVHLVANAGHGTHTSSTAAGDLVENASFMGLAQGLARCSGAPSTWLAIYKVCWSTGGCSSADLLAAFDDAIFDVVDVLSVSLVCSAGNSGPYPEMVINTAPWVITGVANTIDRAFPTAIVLGNNQTVVVKLCILEMMWTSSIPLSLEKTAAVDVDEDSASASKGGSLFPISATKVRDQCCTNGTGNLRVLESSLPNIPRRMLLYPSASLCSSGLCNRNLSVDIHGNDEEIFEDRGFRALKWHFDYSQNFLTRTWSQLIPCVLHTASVKDEYGQSAMADGALDKQCSHIDPKRAIDPGLVYDIKVSDYIRFLCSMGHQLFNQSLHPMPENLNPHKPQSTIYLHSPRIARQCREQSQMLVL